LVVAWRLCAQEQRLDAELVRKTLAKLAPSMTTGQPGRPHGLSSLTRRFCSPARAERDGGNILAALLGIISPRASAVAGMAGPLVNELVRFKFLGIVRRRVAEGFLATVCDQLSADDKFRIRFRCDALQQTLAGGSRLFSGIGRWGLRTVFAAQLALAVVRHRRTLRVLGASVSEFVRGCRANAVAAVAAIFDGEAFERTVFEQKSPVTVAAGLGAGPVIPLRAPRPRRRLPAVPRAMCEPPALRATFWPAEVRRRQALLINPFYTKDPHASFGKHVLTPTLALTSVAGATPPDWEVRYWDENLLQGPPPAEPFPQVVGITVHLTFAKRAFELADWYRRRGATVVLGGLHVVSNPDECAPHADVLALGEGAQVWPRILRDAEAGRLQKIYHGSYRRAYREDPAPRRALLPRGGFLTTASLIATRGCHNRCGFCYLSTDGLHMPWQERDVEQVTGEIRATGEPYAVFIDNNLGSRREYLRRLCRGLRPLQIIWSAAVTLDVTDDPSLVREMARAGCTGVFIGFETLSDRNLAAAGKRSPLTRDYGRRVAMLHDNGIQVNGSFVLGFDHDRRDVFGRTVDWIESNRLECATFHILTPYPGTPLFRQMQSEGRLLHTDWSRYDTAHVVFRPRHMSAEELADGYAWCYERLFGHRSIWRRRPQQPAAVLPYLAMSYLYKRSNLFWRVLIGHRLTHTVWQPLVQATRWRHLRFRQHLADAPGRPSPARMIAPAGV
jgi:radical SAM superfamily enzyme YgiQ (UPF0313 family)